jgi:hypothetical protein
MAGDDLHFPVAALQIGCSTESDIMMGDSMEAIAANALLFIQIIRKTVEKSMGWHLLVKTSIEHGYLRDIGH